MIALDTLESSSCPYHSTSQPAPARPIHMHRLDKIFEELGISQYLGAFVDQGFDSWATILDITESDLDALGVKLGHRRKLQRQIANHRGLAPAASLHSPTRASIEDPSTHVTKAPHVELKDGTTATKRKYRRHPKPDENAPERPPSAYVLFSNKMREDLKGQNLSFTEIAKLVGENWQSLDRAEKEPFETQAQELKDRYNRDMTEYKKTADYKRYNDYLHDFRKRQAIHDAHKRARVEGDSNSRRAAANGMSLGLSATASNGRSGSESQPGSEPPPSRQQRLSSITSQSDVQVSPLISSHTFSRHADDALHSPMSIVHDDRVVSRARGFSSPGSRETTDLSNPRGTGTRDIGHADGSVGHGLPSLSQLSDPRTALAPISHSPENGIPSILPVRPEDARSASNSYSSQFWSRPPSLLMQQSSTGSVSTLSSVAQPRTPSESSMPIHALLSNPEPPAGGSIKSSSESQTLSQSATPMLQHPGRSGDQYFDSRPSFSSDMSSSTSHLAMSRLKQSRQGSFPTSMVNYGSSVAPNMSPAGQSSTVLPRINAADSGLDGMSALLRASDIVGRPEQ